MRTYEDALQTFDFEKVQKIMEVLDWKWANTARGYGIPTISEMIGVVDSLYFGCIRDFTKMDVPYWFHSTGGFKVTIRKNINDPTITNTSIEFILESKEIY